MPAGADEPVGPGGLPTLRDGELVLRPPVAGDVAALGQMLAEPEVARWWGPYTLEAVRAELADQPAWTVWVGDRVGGWVQVVEEGIDGSCPSVGLDIALAAFAQDRGLGRRSLRLAIAHFVAAGHHRFTLDPALANTRAVRAYLGLGFRPVGIMRRYERVPGGGWRDALLMELLAEELIPPPAKRIPAD